MFGSEVLEVGIGVTLILLFVSLICTAAREALEIGLRTRAADLERGIRELLNDRGGTGITKELYSHPLIQSLFLGDYDPRELVPKNDDMAKYMPRAKRANLPSYIPAANFASAILDIVRDKAKMTGPLSVASLSNAVDQIADANLKRAVLSALGGAKDDLDKVKSNLELWFNGTMDRVSGWYKRRTQTILFFIGLVAAIALNVDILTVAKRLSQDKALRESIVSQAKNIVGPSDKADKATLKDLQEQTYKEVSRQIGDVGYPIGWKWDASSHVPSAAPQAWGRNGEALVPGDRLLIAVGWLVTALAAMLGAPFWFDVLNKFMVIRSTVKPREKSQEEGSEDKSKSPQTVTLQLAPGGSK